MLQGLCPAAFVLDDGGDGAVGTLHGSYDGSVRIALTLHGVNGVALLEDLHTLEAHDGQQHQHDHDEDAGDQTIHRRKLA